MRIIGTAVIWSLWISEWIKTHLFYSYEPELHPGVTYKLKKPKATLKIFSTGSITVTGELRHALKINYVVENIFWAFHFTLPFNFFLAPCVASVQAAIEYIFPLVYEFRKERTKEDIIALKRKLRERRAKRGIKEYDEDEIILSTVDDDDVVEEDVEEIEDMEDDEDWDWTMVVRESICWCQTSFVFKSRFWT